MAFLESLFGSPGAFEKVERFTPQQQQLQQQALQQFGPLLQQLQQPADISPILEQRRKSFQEQTVPGLAERFTSLGGSGQRSSAFRGALGSAGAGLEADLAALQSQVGLQDLGRQQQLLGLLSGLGMQPSFESVYKPGSQGLFGAAAQGIGGGLGSFVGSGGNPLAGLMGLLGGRQQAQAQPGGASADQYGNLLQLLYGLMGQQQGQSTGQQYNPLPLA